MLLGLNEVSTDSIKALSNSLLTALKGLLRLTNKQIKSINQTQWLYKNTAKLNELKATRKKVDSLIARSYRLIDMIDKKKCSVEHCYDEYLILKKEYMNIMIEYA